MKTGTNGSLIEFNLTCVTRRNKTGHHEKSLLL